MTVLITGAAGFIGSHLTEECLRKDWDVTAIDCLTAYYSPTAKVRNTEGFRDHPRCEFLEQDLLDLDPLIRDVDVRIPSCSPGGSESELRAVLQPRHAPERHRAAAPLGGSEAH